MAKQKILRRLSGGYVVIEGKDGESVKILESELGKTSKDEEQAELKTETRGRRAGA